MRSPRYVTLEVRRAGDASHVLGTVQIREALARPRASVQFILLDEFPGPPGAGRERFQSAAWTDWVTKAVPLARIVLEVHYVVEEGREFLAVNAGDHEDVLHRIASFVPRGKDNPPQEGD